MSSDIVEIALAKFTDGSLFEKLACEIMRDEGYHDIKRIGTSGDFGMDAAEDVFYDQRGPYKTIFQFTLEDYVLGKLRDTVEKLRRNEIDFQELVLVTRSSLSPRRQENLRKTARKEYGVTANCFEWGTILNRLSDYSNGIFHRHFPDIDKQLAQMHMAKPVFHDSDNAREIAMLRTAIAFGANPASSTTRKSMFDQMVLAIVESIDAVGLTLEEVSQSLSEILRVEPFQLSQVAASIDRLGPDIVCEDGRYSVTAEHEVRVDVATTRINSVTESLISDVVEDVCTTSNQTVSLNDRRRLERNAKDVLRELFRLNCLPLANIATPGSSPEMIPPQAVTGLLDLSKRHTLAKLGELLLATLANVLSHPTPDQARVLAGWARIYLGVALMNLDPTCRECQVTRLSAKLFILDTDMVLAAIVRENPTFNVYRALIEKLVGLGVHVVVPRAVIVECANHAGRSARTCNYHKDRLLQMTPAVVVARVRNLFVRSYYRGITENLIPRNWTYQKFLDNYYDYTDPTGFVTSLLESVLPSAVEIVDLDTLLHQPLQEKALETTTEKMREIMRRRQVADRRTEEDKQLLARNDAKLMLTSLQLNTHGLSDSSKRILWAQCYIVTNSTRYMLAASELELRNVVSTTPEHLIALVENLTGPVASDRELIQLLENPLLTHVVNKMWPDLERMLAQGIALTGKSLVRLRRDLDATLHDQLAAVEEQDRLTDEEADSAVEAGGDYVELISSAEQLGYMLHPLAKQAKEVFSAHDLKDQRIKELEDRVVEYEQAIEGFGKKKQRYLRRMATRHHNK